jgi:hypothetical protein
MKLFLPLVGVKACSSHLALGRVRSQIGVRVIAEALVQGLLSTSLDVDLCSSLAFCPSTSIPSLWAYICVCTPFDLLIYFIISLRLALLGSTTKPRKARVVRASPLGDSIEVDRCTSDVRFHPRYRKLLALLLPVVDRLHRVVSFPPYLIPLMIVFFFFFFPELYGSGPLGPLPIQPACVIVMCI